MLTNPADPSTLLVPLTRGYFAIIDKSDAGAIGTARWQAYVSKRHRTVYAIRTTNDHETEWLHRVLWKSWGRRPAPLLDHRDRDGLNCRQQNIRAATGSQNGQNRAARRGSASGLKGAFRDREKWRSGIRINKSQRHLGTFATAAEAAEAYAAAALENFGEFARTE